MEVHGCVGKVNGDIGQVRVECGRERRFQCGILLTIVMTRAFSKDFLVRRSRGRMFFSRHVLMVAPIFSHSRILAGDSAGVEDEPGKVKPRDSIAVAKVLAVYIPPHAPAPGQACCSMSVRMSSFVLDVSPPSSGCLRVSYMYAP